VTAPTVSDVTTTIFSAAATSHLVNLPATVDPDDLLLIWFHTGDTSPTGIGTPGGWTQIGTLGNSGGDFAYLLKKAVGNEDGTTVDVTTPTALEAVAVCFRIKGWATNFGLTDAVGGGSSSDGGVSVNPDAGVITPAPLPPGGNTLWIATYGTLTPVTTSAYPSGYTNGDTQSSTSLTSGHARIVTSATTENPGAFTISASVAWTAVGIAVLGNTYRPDAKARFKLGVLALRDRVARFGLFPRSNKDAASRFRLQLPHVPTWHLHIGGAPASEDQTFQTPPAAWGPLKVGGAPVTEDAPNWTAGTPWNKVWWGGPASILFNAAAAATTAWRDAPTRFRVAVQRYRDAAARLTLTVRQYRDIGARAVLQVRRYVDTNARLRLVGRTYKDAAARLRFAYRAGGDRYRYEVMTDDPVHYYRHNEPSGSTVVDELGTLSGTYGGSGTVQGAPDGQLAADTAVVFDGNGFATFASRWTAVVNDFALKARIRPDETGRLGLAAYNGDDAGGYGFGQGDGTGGPGNKLVGLFGTVAWIDSGYTFPEFGGRTYDVAMVRSGGTTSFYVDGVVQSGTSAATPNTPTAGKASIGSQETSTRTWKGLINETAIYAHVVSPTRLLAHDAAARVGFSPHARFRLLGSTWRTATARFRLEVRVWRDAAARYVLQVRGFRDAQARARVVVAGLKDAASRFRLWGITWRTAAARFAVTSVIARDATVRFTLAARAFKDAASRIRVAIAKDARVRFVLQSRAYKDAQARAVLTVRAWRDAAARLRLVVSGARDAAVRFVVQARAYRDAKARLVVVVRVLRDASSRFVLNARSYRDAAARAVVQVRGYKDAAVRVALQVRAYRDAPARFALAKAKDAAARFKLWATRHRDAAARFIVTSVIARDAPTRFRLEVRTWRFAASRLVLAVSKDIRVRLVVTARRLIDAATRLTVTVRSFRDAAVRLVVTARAYRDLQARLSVFPRSYRDATARLRLIGRTLRDAGARFVLQVTRDARARFRIVGRVYADARARFSITATIAKDAVARFVLRVQQRRDAQVRVRVVARTYTDAPARTVVVAMRIREAAARFPVSAPIWRMVAGRFKLATTDNYRFVPGRFVLVADVGTILPTRTDFAVVESGPARSTSEGNVESGPRRTRSSRRVG
jgi:concanavalin A-like lectin/glucanase superfamily protein